MAVEGHTSISPLEALRKESAAALKEIQILSEHVKSVRVVRVTDEMELLALSEAFREAVLKIAIESEESDLRKEFGANDVNHVLRVTEGNLAANLPHMTPVYKWVNVLGTALVTGQLDAALDLMTGKAEMYIRTPVFIKLSATNEPNEWSRDTDSPSDAAVRDMEVDYLRARRDYLRESRGSLVIVDDNGEELMEVDGVSDATVADDPMNGLFIPSYVKQAYDRRDRDGPANKLSQPRQPTLGSVSTKSADDARVSTEVANSAYMQSHDEILRAAEAGDQASAVDAVRHYINALTGNRLSTNPEYSEMDSATAREAIQFKKTQKANGNGNGRDQILARRRRRFALTRLHGTDRRPVKPGARLSGADISAQFSPVPEVSDKDYEGEEENVDEYGDPINGDLLRPLSYTSLREASDIYDKVYDLMVRHPDEVYVPHSESDDLADLIRLERESRAYRYGIYEYAKLDDIKAGPIATGERAITDAWAEALIGPLQSGNTALYSKRVKARNAVLADPDIEIPGALWTVPDVAKSRATLELLPTPSDEPTPWKNAPLISRWPGMSQEELDREEFPHARIREAEEIFHWAMGELRRYARDSSGVGTKGRTDPFQFIAPELRTLLALSEIMIQRIPGALKPVDTADRDVTMVALEDEDEEERAPKEKEQTDAGKAGKANVPKATPAGGDDDDEESIEEPSEDDEDIDVGMNVTIPQTNLFGYWPDVGISPLYMGLRLFDWYSKSSNNPPQQPQETNEAYATRLATAVEVYELLSLENVRRLAVEYAARYDKEKPQFLRMVTEDPPLVKLIERLYVRAYPDLFVSLYDDEEEKEEEEEGASGKRTRYIDDRASLASNTESVPAMIDFMLKQVLETNRAGRALNYRTITEISNAGSKASGKRVRRLFNYIATWLRTYTAAILKDVSRDIRAEFRKIQADASGKPATSAQTVLGTDVAPLLDKKLATLLGKPSDIDDTYKLLAAMFTFDGILRHSRDIMTKQVERSSLRFKMRSGVLAWRASPTQSKELFIVDTDASEASLPNYTKMINSFISEAPVNGTVHRLLGLGLVTKHISARIQITNDSGKVWMRNVQVWLVVPPQSLRLGVSYIPFDLAIEDSDLNKKSPKKVSSINMPNASRLETPLHLSAIHLATKPAAKTDDPTQRMTPVVIADNIADAVLKYMPSPSALEAHVREVLVIPDKTSPQYDESVVSAGLSKIKSTEHPSDAEKAEDGELPEVRQLFGGGGGKTQTAKDKPQD
jgi:hypothetical protein